MRILLALFPVIAFAQVQNPQIGYTTTDPTGNACGNTRIQLKTPDGKLYTCQSGHMALVQNSSGTPTNPVVVTFNTATPSCSATGGGTTPTCSATSSPAKVIAVHNLGTTTPITECYDSTGLAAGSAGSAFGVPGIQVNTGSQETITFSVPANGSCVISSGGQGAQGPTGPAGGVTSVYGLTGAVVPTGANIVSSFTGCSGTQYLGADGACHNSGTIANPYTNINGALAYSSNPLPCLSGVITFTQWSGIGSQQGQGTRLFTAPAGWIYVFSRVELSSGFTGTGITNLSLALGTAAVPTGYMANYQILPASGTPYNEATGPFPGSAGNVTVDFFGQLTVTGGAGNLSALTAGGETIKVCGMVP